MAQQAYFDPPAFAMEAEVTPVVPDAQSARNEVRVAVAVGDASGSHDVVAEPPQEITLTHNHLSKCLSRIISLVVTPSGHLLISLFPYISAYAAGDIPDNVDFPPGEGFRASNSVDSEPYEIAIVVDSDDDRPVGEMTESNVEMLRRVYSGRRDPRVHEFGDLTLLDQACAEGRDDELQQAPEAGLEMTVEKERVFRDLPTLKRWLQAFTVIRKRPYKVLHSFVER
jgi:hypothetical protein